MNSTRGWCRIAVVTALFAVAAGCSDQAGGLGGAALPQEQAAPADAAAAVTSAEVDGGIAVTDALGAGAESGDAAAARPIPTPKPICPDYTYMTGGRGAPLTRDQAIAVKWRVPSVPANARVIVLQPGDDASKLCHLPPWWCGQGLGCCIPGDF